MLRKSSPEELPGSNFLLVTTFVFFLLSQIPVGIRCLFNLIIGPFLFAYAPYLRELSSLDELQIPAWITLIVFIVTIWSVLVMAHIFSRAISKTPSVGLGLTLVYVLINFFISSSIS